MRREARRRNALPDPDDHAAAYTKALRLLTVRSRGREELRRALVDRGFAAAAAQEALVRLEAGGWLDDLGAARAWVRARSGRFGRSRIERELAARGFSEETIDRAMAEAPGPQEEKALRDLFRKLWAAGAALPPEKRRRRVWSALVRRGFGGGSISAMMKGSGPDDDELQRDS